MDDRPISGTLIGRAAGFPEPSARLIDLGHLLVADADRDPAPRRRDELRRLRSARGLSENDDLWPELERLAPLLTEQWAATWRVATLALLAVNHPWYLLDDLQGGVLHRRLDAIYDAFDTDFCAHEVQTYYWEIVEGLIEAGESGGTSALKIVVSIGLGPASDSVTGHVVSMAAPPSPPVIRERLIRPTTRTLEIAAVVLLWTLLPEGERGRSEAEELLVKRCQVELRDLGDRGDGDPRLRRMWRSTLSMMGGELDEGSVMPDLTGKPLDLATSLAETWGLNLTPVDAGESPLVAGMRRGAQRSVWDASSWRVIHQYPPGGSPLTDGVTVVAIAKHGEHTLDPLRLVPMVEDRFKELAAHRRE